jgi:hypothetical protein
MRADKPATEDGEWVLWEDTQSSLPQDERRFTGLHARDVARGDAHGRVRH